MNASATRAIFLATAWSLSLAAAGCKDSGEYKATGTVVISGAHGPVIDAENFTTRQIPDAQQGGLVAGVFSVPENWAFNSQVKWNYGHINSPFMITAQAETTSAGPFQADCAEICAHSSGVNTVLGSTRETEAMGER